MKSKLTSTEKEPTTNKILKLTNLVVDEAKPKKKIEKTYTEKEYQEGWRRGYEAGARQDYKEKMLGKARAKLIFFFDSSVLV